MRITESPPEFNMFLRPEEVKRLNGRGRKHERDSAKEDGKADKTED